VAIASGSEGLEVGRRLLAIAAGLQLVADLLALGEGGQARALDGGNVDECVLAATGRLDETEAFGGVEEFDGAFSNFEILEKADFRRTTRPAGDVRCFLRRSMAGQGRQQREILAKRIALKCASLLVPARGARPILSR
jgi:hypothetical protein